MTRGATRGVIGAVAAAACAAAIGGAAWAEGRAQFRTEERAAWLVAGMEAFWTPNLEPARRGAAAPLATEAPNAIVIDVETGVVLAVKSAERAIPPASMTKLMTALMVFEALDRGEIRLDDTISVSARAAAAPGSTMGLRAGDAPTVDELLSGIIVASGNDAAIAIAEALGGTEAEFARAMTARARELGLETASFRNATGLPADGHTISVADIAELSARLIAEHPERFGYFGEASMRYRGVRWWNRNPALSLDLGDLGARADGLKTGHTRAAGYCVAASAIIETADGPRRVVVVLAGLPSERARARETEVALRWAITAIRALD